MLVIFSSRSLAFAGLGVRAQGGSFELLIEFVDLIERLLIGLGALIVLFLGGILRVIDLRLRVLGFVVFLERAIHVDGADFHSLRESSDGKCDRSDQGDREKFFHNGM